MGVVARLITSEWLAYFTAWPRISVWSVHCLAVRLCALVYFFAFLGNVVDGPILWLISPPQEPYTKAGLLRLNQWALLPAIVAVLRPWFWPALAVCWPLWHRTYSNGGRWYHFGWDEMMDEIGFLSVILAITLTLYDDVAEHPDDLQSGLSTEREMGNPEEKSPVLEDPDFHAEVVTATKDGETQDLRQRRPKSPDPATAGNRESTSPGTPGLSQSLERFGAFGGALAKASEKLGAGCTIIHRGFTLLFGAGPAPPRKSHPVEAAPMGVDWARTAAEVGLTLAGFRLFLAAGLVKMRRGSACWHDHTCLYDHWETQPMPNPLAWYFHSWAPLWMKRIFQIFAIDIVECLVPYLLLAFLISMGPLSLVYSRLCDSEHWYVRWPARFPCRLTGAVLIMLFVLGMFISGNYAFLHPLSIVSLVASMGTLRGVPLSYTREAQGDAIYLTKLWYRRLAAWAVLLLAVFAFLPSIRAYGWLFYEDEDAFTRLMPLEESSFVQRAQSWSLGIPYNHHAYFAGAVHSRFEAVLWADVGNGWVELDIPCKVGRIDRAPCHTSPLHRRFAWEWWFLPLGGSSNWLPPYLAELCKGTPEAWNALEHSTIHDQIKAGHNVKRLKLDAFQYHFVQPGEHGWWTRTPSDDFWAGTFKCQTLLKARHRLG